MRTLLLVFSLLVITSSAVYAQAVPVIGEFVSVSASQAPTCEILQSESNTTRSTLDHPLFLPLVFGGTEVSGPQCPVVAIGANMLLDAQVGDTFGEILFAPGSEAWYTTDINTVLAPTSIYSPTISQSDWLSITTGTLSDAGQLRIVGVWPVTFTQSLKQPQPIPGAEDYLLGERLRETEMRMVRGELPNLWPVTSSTRFATVPDSSQSVSLATICPEAVGKTFYVQHEGTLPSLPPFPDWLVLVSHPQDQIPTVCPDIQPWVYMPGVDFWKLLPAADRQSIREQVDKDTRIYSRQLWGYPRVGDWTPQPAAARWTAITAGAAVHVYMQFSGGIGGGSAWLVFAEQ